MNIINAVNLLNEGKCKTIVSPNGQIYELDQNNVITNVITRGGISLTAKSFLSDNWSIENITSIEDDVVVTRYAAIDDKGNIIATSGRKEEVGFCFGSTVVELKGSYKKKTPSNITIPKQIVISDNITISKFGTISGHANLDTVTNNINAFVKPGKLIFEYMEEV